LSITTDVLNEVAKNLSARLSQMTMGKFVVCAERDDKLTLSIFERADVPRHSFVNWCGSQRKGFLPS
jgi:hypothetical protein